MCVPPCVSEFDISLRDVLECEINVARKKHPDATHIFSLLIVLFPVLTRVNFSFFFYVPVHVCQIYLQNNKHAGKMASYATRKNASIKCAIFYIAL